MLRAGFILFRIWTRGGCCKDVDEPSDTKLIMKDVVDRSLAYLPDSRAKFQVLLSGGTEINC